MFASNSLNNSPSSEIYQRLVEMVFSPNFPRSHSLDFRTASVSANPSAWQGVLQTGAVSIIAEYGENADTGRWALSISVESDGAQVLRAASFGDRCIKPEAATPRIAAYSPGFWNDFSIRKN